MNEDAIRNPSPGAFDLDANVLRSNLPLFFFSVESLDRQFSGTTVAASAWRREKRDRGPGPKGYGPFIDPRIPDTSGICGLAVFVLKIHSLDSNPLLNHFLIQNMSVLDLNKV